MNQYCGLNQFKQRLLSSLLSYNSLVGARQWHKWELKPCPYSWRHDSPKTFGKSGEILQRLQNRQNVLILSFCTAPEVKADILHCCNDTNSQCEIKDKVKGEMFLQGTNKLGVLFVVNSWPEELWFKVSVFLSAALQQNSRVIRAECRPLHENTQNNTSGYNHTKTEPNLFLWHNCSFRLTKFTHLLHINTTIEYYFLEFMHNDSVFVFWFLTAMKMRNMEECFKPTHANNTLDDITVILSNGVETQINRPSWRFDSGKTNPSNLTEQTVTQGAARNGGCGSMAVTAQRLSSTEPNEQCHWVKQKVPTHPSGTNMAITMETEGLSGSHAALWVAHHRVEFTGNLLESQRVQNRKSVLFLQWKSNSSKTLTVGG